MSYALAMFNKEMDLTSAILTISILILAILWYVYNLTFSNQGPPLPPGPRGLPIVGYLPFLGDDLYKQYTKMARTYGPIFKLQVGSKVHVVINTMDLAKVVLREQDETFANRDPPLAASIGTFGEDIVWSNNNSDWRKLRKIFVHEALSNKNLEACRVYRREEVRRTIKNIYDKIGTSININNTAFSTEANVLTSMIWQNTSVKGEKDRELVGEFQKIVHKIIELISQPNLSDIFPSLAWFDIQGIAQKAKLQRKQFDQIFTSIIHDRKKTYSEKSMVAVEHEGKKDFLQILLDLMEEKNATYFGVTHIKAILADMMIGGTDTTTTLIEWAMAEIMHNDKVRKRVQEELVEVVGLNNIVEESHLPKLQYLDAIIKETLRLHPVAPMLIPRSPSQSCIVGGYRIPKGCTVFVNVWAIQRNPVYWDKPLEFNPERFMANNWDYKGNNLNYFPFGSGRRLCPGIPLAEQMMMYILASLLHSFDWDLPKGEEHDLTDKFSLTLRKRKPLILVPSQRLPDISLYM